MSKGFDGYDNIPYHAAMKIIQEAKGLLDMASKGLPSGPEKTALTKLRNDLWGIMRKLKKGGVAK